MQMNSAASLLAPHSLSIDEKALAHLFHCDEVSKQPSALLLPEWTGFFGQLPNALKSFQNPAKTPFVNISTSGEMIEALRKYSGNCTFLRNCTTICGAIDAFFFIVGAGNRGFALTFDVQVPEIAKAFQVWSRKGYIPCQLIGPDDTVFVSLPLDKASPFIDFMREARMHPVELSQERMELVDAAANSPYLQCKMPFEHSDVIPVWTTAAIVGGCIKAPNTGSDGSSH